MSDEYTDLKEREEQAQIIIDTAIQRVSEMGFGIVADGTIDGDGMSFSKLRVIPSKVDKQ